MQPEPGPLLKRYHAGEHEAVWADMMALGAKVRESPCADDARNVARETMRRARQNVESIIRRLDRLGYKFWDGTQGPRKSAPASVVFGEKIIEAWPIEARLAALFEEARNIPPAQFTPAMIRELHTAYQLAMYPWQDPALLLKGQRFPADAELTALCDRIKRTPSELTPDLLNRLCSLHSTALEQARNYWKAKGEEPPAIRRQREKENLLIKQSAIADHLKDRKVFCPPAKKDLAAIGKLEKKGVHFPLALRAWIEEVGDVNLAGDHPQLCFWDTGPHAGVYADPLMVVPHLFTLEIEDWHKTRQESEPFEALIGWDAKTKARLTLEDKELDYGYTATIPNAAADAPLHGTPHATLVDFLRHAFRWGGFPGWEQYPNRPERELRILTENLLPI